MHTDCFNPTELSLAVGSTVQNKFLLLTYSKQEVRTVVSLMYYVAEE
jgi:hypothetical protein